MTLHEAISQVLLENGGSMTTTEIANALNRNGLYTKKDGSAIIAYQIHGRTKNYPHLFDKDGSTVSLKSKTGIRSVVQQLKIDKPTVSEALRDFKLMTKVLMNEKNFKSAAVIDNSVPDLPGFYCIRISDPKQLKSTFANVLIERNHNIIYIGIASQSLKKRFLGQELRARGHGTFFRSLGAVLGYRPEQGSLLDKMNQNNYTFSPSDEKKIINWINQNLLVNWIPYAGNLNGIENDLIKEHLPLLNISGNPGSLPQVQALREECKRIGRANIK